jgi:hypothetical protein
MLQMPLFFAHEFLQSPKWDAARGELTDNKGNKAIVTCLYYNTRSFKLQGERGRVDCSVFA